MKTDVLIIHPQKHHVLHLVAGSLKSGRRTMYVTPYHQKGLGNLVTKMPGLIGAKARGYRHEGVPAAAVYSPLHWQLQQLASFSKSNITSRFDTWCAKNIQAGIWDSKVVITVQDYLPQTTIAAKKMGCVVVSDQISNQSATAMDRVSRHYQSCGMQMPEHDETTNQRIIDLADHVLVPSQYTLEGIRHWLRPMQKAHIVPYGVAVDRFHPADLTESKRIRVICRANTVRKGGHLLLQAIQKIACDLSSGIGVEVDWTFLGTLEPVLEPLAVQVRSALPRSMRLEARNFAHMEVPHLLARSSLFVMPSLSEGMSLAALEAASAGLPMIMTRYCGVDEFEQKRHGLLVEDDVDSLAQALTNALAQRSKWQSWGQNCRELALRHTWDRYQSSIKQIIADV
jgi:hypothetical protein